MFLTIAVLMLPVLLITWFFTRTPDEPPIKEVDWETAVTRAKQADRFDVLTLAALPAGWRATKAVWADLGERLPSGDVSPGATLELGFLSDDERYFAINQTLAPAAPYLTRVTREGTKRDQVEIAGTTWDHYVSADGRTHALVQRQGGLTRALVSDAGRERLVDVAGMLKQA